MKKDNAKKRRRKDMWSSLAWEKVDVSNTKIPSHETVSNSSKKSNSQNEDETVNAVFFGLEVIDGSKYEIRKTKLNPNSFSSIIKENDENDGTLTTVVPVKHDTNLSISTNKNDKLKTPIQKSNMNQTTTDDPKQPQKNKAKIKNKSNPQSNNKHNNGAPITKTVIIPPPTDTKILSIQNSWSQSCQNSIWLHPTLAFGLWQQQFIQPTPIQSATLPASILGRRNIVGAAPTGSGKTLAYALPILQYLLEERDADTHNKHNETKLEVSNDDRLLRALIMCPTRELALQVSKEIKTACVHEISVGTIVGGLAEQKQKRVLDKIRPSILVATPGRLWELVRV